MRLLPKAIGFLRRSARDERGGTVAELAIILPFLALMFGSVAEIGRYFQTYSTLSKATRSAARYLSNHEINDAEKNKAKNLVVCGKLACADADPKLVKNISAANVCVEYFYPEGSPKPETVTVSIPRAAGDCGEDVDPHMYAPIFDLGAMLNNPTFTMALPISPGTTMYYML